MVTRNQTVNKIWSTVRFDQQSYFKTVWSTVRFDQQYVLINSPFDQQSFDQQSFDQQSFDQQS